MKLAVQIRAKCEEAGCLMTMVAESVIAEMLEPVICVLKKADGDLFALDTLSDREAVKQALDMLSEEA